MGKKCRAWFYFLSPPPPGPPFPSSMRNLKKRELGFLLVFVVSRSKLGGRRDGVGGF